MGVYYIFLICTLTLLCEQLGSLVGITFRMLTTDINSCNLFALFSIFSSALPTIASQLQYLVLFFTLNIK